MNRITLIIATVLFSLFAFTTTAMACGGYVSLSPEQSTQVAAADARAEALQKLAETSRAAAAGASQDLGNLEVGKAGTWEIEQARRHVEQLERIATLHEKDAKVAWTARYELERGFLDQAFLDMVPQPEIAQGDH